MALVFMDLDGTLLDEGKPAENIHKTIELLKAKGHIPVIASGRVPHLLKHVSLELGIDNYVAANGNYVWFENKVIYERYIPKETIRRLAGMADELGFDLALESVDNYVAHRKNTSLVSAFSGLFKIDDPKVDRNYYYEHDILSCVVFEDEKIDILKRAFPELVFNRTNRFGYDVNLAGGLKITGIRFLIDHLGYPLEEVYAIGDGFNDIDMLEAIPNSIAMGNAHPEVKAVCRYVTDDVDKEGVYKAFRYFNLI